MTDITPEAVERLTGPAAEAMPDGERLTALVQMCRALSAEVERLTSHHYTGSRVEDAITAHWGSRCYDFAEGCSCCEAWAEYDRLTAAAQTPPEDVGAVARAAETLRLDQKAMTELVMHQFRHRTHATAGEIDRRRKKMDACLAALAKQGGAE